MTSPLQQAREMFPLMPEGVFECWLDERIQSNGWPPSGSRWNGALRGRPISWWQQLSWSRELVELRYDLLAPGTQKIIQGLHDANIRGIRNEYSRYLDDSRERMRSILVYVQKTGGLPPGLVFIENENCLDVVEGCHRLAVYFACRWTGECLDLRPREEVWVGRPVNGA